MNILLGLFYYFNINKMKIQEIKKEIKGVFKQPKIRIYFGKIKYGSPYFEPVNFLQSIIKIRKLKLKTTEELHKSFVFNSYFTNKYSNLPMVRRTYNKIIKVFNNDYFIQIGFPITFKILGLGWKDKYETPRFEWPPAIYFYFFYWQLIIFFGSPIKNKDDEYYEHILWYLNYSDKDLQKTIKTWPWQNATTKESTWSNEFLINNNE